MHRRLTTHWSEKEIRQFRKLVKVHAFENKDDLALLERYYEHERKKGDKGWHKRDLYTFLNNFFGEVDRAVLWGKSHPLKTERKIIPLPNLAHSDQPEIAPRTPEELEAHKRFMLEFLERKARNNKTLDSLEAQA